MKNIYARLVTVGFALSLAGGCGNRIGPEGDLRTVDGTGAESEPNASGGAGGESGNGGGTTGGAGGVGGDAYGAGAGGTAIDGSANQTFYRPDVSFVTLCSDASEALSANESVRKLSKAELLKALQSAVLEYHMFFDLENLREYRSYSSRAFDGRPPLQMAMNEYIPDTTDLPGEQFITTYTEEQMAAWAKVVHLVASDFAGGSAVTNYVSAGCYEGNSVPSRACLDEFVRALGHRVYRRELEDEEAELVTSFALEAANAEEATYRVMSFLFLSPQFLYMTVLEDGEADGERVPRSQLSIANWIAFNLTGEAPDAALLRAAENGELSTVAAIKEQAARIIRTDAAKEKLLGFFDDWLGISEVIAPANGWGEAMRVPRSNDSEYYGTIGLETNLAQEIIDYVQYIIWETEGTYQDLLTAKVAIVRDARMQVIYDTDGFDEDGGASPSPGHPGLLARAGLLAGGSVTNPIMRAVRIREQILCQYIPSPDFSVVAARQEGADELDPIETPNHEITAELTSPDNCQACHSMINPVGFLFEGFNPLGQRQTEETIVRSVSTPSEWPDSVPIPTNFPKGVNHAIAATHPLPGAQDFSVEGDGVTASFESPEQLVEAIADSNRGPSCMAVRFFRHLQRRSETDADACQLARGVEALQSATILDAFIELLVGEEIFWRKS